MTNHEKIFKTSVYDLLVGMSENTSKCIVDMINSAFGDYNDYPCFFSGCDCKKCIAKWLNEEAET